MNTIEPNGSNKLIGFLIQLLGFSMFFFGAKEIYYWRAHTWIEIGNWHYSSPPLWYSLPFIIMFIVGILVIIYGVIVFIKDVKYCT